MEPIRNPLFYSPAWWRQRQAMDQEAREDEKLLLKLVAAETAADRWTAEKVHTPGNRALLKAIVGGKVPRQMTLRELGLDSDAKVLEFLEYFDDKARIGPRVMFILWNRKELRVRHILRILPLVKAISAEHFRAASRAKALHAGPAPSSVAGADRRQPDRNSENGRTASAGTSLKTAPKQEAKAEDEEEDVSGSCAPAAEFCRLGAITGPSVPEAGERLGFFVGLPEPASPPLERFFCRPKAPPRCGLMPQQKGRRPENYSDFPAMAQFPVKYSASLMFTLNPGFCTGEISGLADMMRRAEREAH